MATRGLGICTLMVRHWLLDTEVRLLQMLK